MPHSRLISIDKLAQSSELRELIANWGRHSVIDALRSIQGELRADDSIRKDITFPEYRDQALIWLRANRPHGYQRVFNLTGTLIHTNLGRATMDQKLVQRALRVSTRPVTLEYDLNRGTRGDRECAIRQRLQDITGAESAVIVNNNAAAVWIALNSLAYNKEVIVSRSELIEIGGSFRLPELMSRSECKLVEVGTTNRTWLKDYESAITNETALLLKVHPSNYSIRGFTHSVSEKELIELATRMRIPFMLDLGSGALTDLQCFGLPAEPLPSSLVETGVNLVSFSGDKLLGGPQAGIIVGRKSLCTRINANPLKRALRTDKLSLALLDETLKAYEDPKNLHKNVRLIRDLTVTSRQLNHRATQVQTLLQDKLTDFKVYIDTAESQIGSGSQPDTKIATKIVSIHHEKQSEVVHLEQHLRELSVPVIGRIHKKSLLLDMRGADPLDELLHTLDFLA